ncbi:MAG: DNA polymerase III subunit epsilon [Burkholderiales bacterium]|nr:MAG: DNA polymerase III subunit epsilon [Burkholderiales bacterium]
MREIANLPDALLALGDFAFIDVETTGTKPLEDRLTEVAIIRFSRAHPPRVWQSLVNPGVPIPSEIQALTGITNRMVRDAPTFFDLRDELRGQLEGAYFVAHNARFDYGFIKNEFRRAGEPFTSDVLCTVRLSRKLYPGASGHGLDAIVARHRLQIENRHRALGDTLATAQFVHHACSEHSEQSVAAAARALLKMPSLPAHLPPDALDALPDSPGVYLFYGINDLPIYIGKAKALRERVRAHFSSDHMSPNDVRLSQELRRIEWMPTAGEFGALLLESQLVKEKLPLHNVALRRKEKIGFLVLDEASDVPRWMSASEEVQTLGAPSVLRFGPFTDKASARKWLMYAGKEHELCDHALGFSSPRIQGERCFSRQVGRCHGVCEGAEGGADHRARVLDAFGALAFPPWPFEGRAIYEERDVANDRVDLLEFDRWCALTGGEPLPFDGDVYRLLVRTLARYPDRFSGTAAF